MSSKARSVVVFAVTALCAHAAIADSVVVKGSIVYYSSAGLLNIALAPGASLPSSCPAGTTLPASINVANATADSDIVISGATAFVKTGNTVTSVTIAPACLAEGSLNVSECIAHFDSATGDLLVPCVEYQGTIYDAVLQQRGNSMNWELNSALPNVRFHPGGNQ